MIGLMGNDMNRDLTKNGEWRNGQVEA